MRVRATWTDGVAIVGRFRRRWFPWPTDSVVFGRTCFTSLRLNPVYLDSETVIPDGLDRKEARHEMVHVRQYAERGWWWTWFHPRRREAEGRAAEWSTEPRLEVV